MSTSSEDDKGKDEHVVKLRELTDSKRGVNQHTGASGQMAESSEGFEEADKKAAKALGESVRTVKTRVARAEALKAFRPKKKSPQNEVIFRKSTARSAARKGKGLRQKTNP